MSFRYISRQQALILQLIGDRQRYAMELVRSSQGRLARGTAYETLRRMVAKGLVRKDPIAGPTGKERYFEATELGRTSLARYREATAGVKKTA